MRTLSYTRSVFFVVAGSLLALFASNAEAQPQANQQTVSRLVIDFCSIDSGAGTPEGNRAAVPCSMFLQTDGAPGSILWVKETGSGTTGWVAMGAGGGGSTHSILSSTHTDSLTNTAVRGAIVTGQTATPRWGRLSPGGTGTFVQFNGTDTVFSSDGGGLTGLNGAQVTFGQIPVARLGTGTADSSTYLRGDGTWTAAVTASHNLLSATHPDATAGTVVRGDLIVGQSGPTFARLALGTNGYVLRSNGTDAVWSNDGSVLGSLNASNLSSGTVPDARFPATLPAASGVNLTALNASNLGSGTAPTARLGSGTANSSSYLRGDSTWVAAPNPFDQSLNTTNTPQFARLGIGGAADASAAIKITGQYYAVEIAAGSSGTSKTINWNDGIQHTVTLTGNVTFTFSNPKEGGRYLLILTQDGTGSRTVTWPGTVKWAGGIAPTLTTAAGSIDICTLAYTAAGSGIYVAACNLDIK